MCLEFEYLSLTCTGKKILEKAIKGDMQAQRDVGCLHIWGEEGFPKCEERARYYYTLAAEKGHCEAMWDVSTMYLNGEGGEPDIFRGLFYLKKAASRRRWDIGAENAASFLEYIYTEGLFGLDNDENQASYWSKVSKELHRKYRGWKRKYDVRGIR